MSDHILALDYDIFGICETWLNCEATNDTHINSLLPPGYCIHHVDRANNGTGGGVALVYKQHLNIKILPTNQYTQFEHIHCSLITKTTNVDITVFYRPPPSQLNGFTSSRFLEEWEEFVSQCVLSKSEIIIMGDVNIHLDNSNLCSTHRFINILNSCGLQQHVQEPTHHHGHILDVLISRDTSTCMKNVDVKDIGLCNDYGNLLNDHYAITSTFQLDVQTPNRKCISYRRTQDIDIDVFCENISSSNLLTDTTGTLDELVERFSVGLSILLDTHAPIMQRIITLRPHAPWYNETICNAKQLRRLLERIWRRHKQIIAYQAYRTQCSVIAKLIDTSKTVYYSNKIEDCKGNTKELYSITNKLLVNQHQRRLPSVQHF